MSPGTLLLCWDRALQVGTSHPSPCGWPGPVQSPLGVQSWAPGPAHSGWVEGGAGSKGAQAARPREVVAG